MFICGIMVRVFFCFLLRVRYHCNCSHSVLLLWLVFRGIHISKIVFSQTSYARVQCSPWRLYAFRKARFARDERGFVYFTDVGASCISCSYSRRLRCVHEYLYLECMNELVLPHLSYLDVDNVFTLESSTLPQPIPLDLNGDMKIDLLGITPDSERHTPSAPFQAWKNVWNASQEKSPLFEMYVVVFSDGLFRY